MVLERIPQNAITSYKNSKSSKKAQNVKTPNRNRKLLQGIDMKKNKVKSGLKNKAKTKLNISEMESETPYVVCGTVSRNG